MTIAGRDIPLPNGALPVTSNLGYWLVAVVVAMMGAWGGKPIMGGLASLGLIVQGAGSMLYHGTGPDQRWAQLFDAVGIQWALTALIGAGLSQIFPWATSLVVPLVLASWVLAWMSIDNVSRIPLIIGEAVALVLMVGFLVGWPLAAFIGVLLGAAFGIQQYSDPHSLGHVAWHFFSAFAQFIGARALLMLA